MTKKSYVVDTETNSLEDYTMLHIVAFREVLSNEVTVFRNVHDNRGPCLDFIQRCVGHWIGHNFIGFDMGVLKHFTGIDINVENVTDTLVISRMLNFNQPGGHSLEAWGTYFKQPKSTYSDFSVWSQPLEDRCIKDTEINLLLYNKFLPYINSPRWGAAFRLEALTSSMCTLMYTLGMTFDYPKAILLYNSLFNTLNTLEGNLQKSFLPKSKYIRTIVPKSTLKGTLNSKDFRWMPGEEKDLRPYTADSAFSLFTFEEFNPQSSEQRVARLNEAGWKPVNKTKGHIQAIRDKDTEKLKHYAVYGWTTDEENLSTLPDTAPEGARQLAHYLLLASRLSNLKQWIDLARRKPQEALSLPTPTTPPETLETGCTGLTSDPRGYWRVHGTFTNPGAWSMRVSHQKPNMANVPAVLNRKGKVALYGKELRELWTVPEGYKLVGVDADSIQLRIFAHLCEDDRLIAAISRGRKEDKSDIHHLNKDIIGPICISREVAKTYIYALLLGAGLAKQASTLDCTKHEASQALKRILDYYPGWKRLLSGRLASEGERGYIECLDGRYLPLPEPRLALAGHLQSGEKIIMSQAMQNWIKKLEDDELRDYKLVNWVHDEWCTEVADVGNQPDEVGDAQVWGIEQAGRDFNMKIALTGNKKIGLTWADVH